jgi:adenosine/AMP kinase
MTEETTMKEDTTMQLRIVAIDKPEDMNVILGQSHFIKTVEDLYEAIVQTNPAMRFGIAFCEASGPALVRWVGNDDELVGLAQKNATAVGAGHSFLIFLRGGFPVNILNAVKAVPEVARIFCATANPLQVVVAETAQGRGILGVIDGVPPAGVETQADIAKRRSFLRTIGYKL